MTRVMRDHERPRTHDLVEKRVSAWRWEGIEYRDPSAPDVITLVLKTYQDILRIPGAAAFCAAGLLARVPMSTLNLGIVVLISSTKDSFGAAGVVAACYVLAQALALPWLGHRIDHYGQARIMLPAAAVHVLAVAALIVSVLASWPLVVPAACALLAGLSVGSPGALVRARWSYVLSDSQRQHTAMSWESTLDEVLFIGGPVLVMLLATLVHPAAGVALALAAFTVGVPLLLAQRRTEPPALRATTAGPEKTFTQAGTAITAGASPHRRVTVLTSPTMRVLVVTYALLGAVFGAVDVTTVAFADARDQPALAGPVLAIFAFASLLAGLAFGARRWRRPPHHLLLAATAVLATGLVLTT